MQDQFIKDVFYSGKFHEESLEKAKKEVEYIVKYKENYLKAYFCTKKAFLKADPIVGIAFMDWYEYDQEIIDMASRLKQSKSHSRMSKTSPKRCWIDGSEVNMMSMDAN